MALSGEENLFDRLDRESGGKLSAIVGEIWLATQEELAAFKAEAGVRMDARFFWACFDVAVDMAVSDEQSMWPDIVATVCNHARELRRDVPEDLEKVKAELEERSLENFDEVVLLLYWKAEGMSVARFNRGMKERLVPLIPRQSEIRLKFFLFGALAKAFEEV